MKAVDAATGQLAAALQLKIYPNFVPTIIAPWELDVDHWEGAEREQAQQCWMELQGSVNEQIGRFGEGGEAHLRRFGLFFPRAEDGCGWVGFAGLLSCGFGFC